MQTFIDSIDFQLVSNLLLTALLIYLLFYLIMLMIERRKREQLLSLHRKRNSAQRIGDRIRSIQVFYDEIEDVLKKKGNEHVADMVFYGILLLAGVIGFAMIFTGQYLLAIAYPVLFIFFVRKIFNEAKADRTIELEEELPATIDNIIRIFSKYSDVKTVIYETSLIATGPIKKELDQLTRQMNTRSPEKVLEEFSEKHNSVWLNNFGFTLLGYLEDSSKDETIRNLRHLRQILDRENTSKKKAISERKPSLMINYALAAIGVIGAFGNILFNPQAFDFFFHSYLGLFCFTAGFGFVLGTIYMNIKMMKIEK